MPYYPRRSVVQPRILRQLCPHPIEEALASTDSIPRILHIDDDEDDRKMFARAFARSGLAGVLHGVGSVSEALLFLNRLGSYIAAHQPRLIVLDLSIPGIDGREFLEVIKSNVIFKSISVVVLTGSENYTDMQRCRELGVDDYVVKPRTNQELIELIASFGRWLCAWPTEVPKPS
jgi:CheY-like chemotaxis protein